MSAHCGRDPSAIGCCGGTDATCSCECNTCSPPYRDDDAATIAALRADLARVTQERGAFYEVATQRMHDCNRLEKERDGARARAAFYEEERDGARARAERAEADAAAMREALEAARPWVSIHGGDDGASAAMPAGAGCNVGARIDAALVTSAGTWLLAQLAAHRAFTRSMAARPCEGPLTCGGSCDSCRARAVEAAR